MAKIKDFSQKYTNDSFRQLLNIIELNPVQTPSNSQRLISTLISITEALIWSDQNHIGLFEIFAESNVIETLTCILTSQPDRQITIQLLRCSTLLIHNLLEQSSKDFLISSQLFSELISQPFDFTDDEVVENYTSMLKGFAVNLTRDQLVHLVTSKNFSLFTSAMMFFNYKENLVKTAARAVVLNVLKLKSEYVNKYVLESGFMFNLVNSIRDSVGLLGKSQKVSIGQMEEMVFDVMDTVFYVNDIIEEQNEKFNKGVLVHMKIVLVFPVLAGSLFAVHLQPQHIPIPTSLYIISQILMSIKFDEIKKFILNLLFSETVPKSYCECMQQALCTEESLECDQSLEPNPLLQNLKHFLKCRDDNLVALTLNLLLVSLTHGPETLLKSFGLLPGTRPETYIHWVELIGEILTLDQDFRFFTCLSATRCLHKMLSKTSNLSHSLISQIFKNASIRMSDVLISGSASPKAPKDYSKLMKSQWEFVKSIKWEEKIVIPLHLISPTLDETKIALENRRCLTETEYVMNDMRFFWLYRRYFAGLNEIDEEDCYPIFINLLCEVDVEKIYRIYDRCFVDKPKILVKSKEKKGVYGKVLVRDENFFILLGSIEGTDWYKIDALKSLTQVVLPENSASKQFHIFLQDRGKVELIFEDTMEWLSIKNFYEKSVKNAKTAETIEIQNFLREQKRILNNFE